jgi:uncharacterized coiled-coil DUF342 family protein
MFGITYNNWNEQLSKVVELVNQSSSLVSTVEKEVEGIRSSLCHRVWQLEHDQDILKKDIQELCGKIGTQPSDNSPLQYYRQRIGTLLERLDSARKALGERDQRIKALVQCQVESDKVENALHHEIAERDVTIRGMDSRILSLLDEIRAKNVTIARLQGMGGRVESPDEPGIPCQS